MSDNEASYYVQIWDPGIEMWVDCTHGPLSFDSAMSLRDSLSKLHQERIFRII